MSRPTPPSPSRPLTTAALSRLLMAVALGCALVAAIAVAVARLTGHPVTLAPGVLAVVGAAAAFGSAIYEIGEWLIARRAARRVLAATAAAPAPDVASLTAQLTLYRDVATLTAETRVGAALDRWLEEELTARDVARAAVDALLGADPEVLDGLRQVRAHQFEREPATAAASS